MRQTPDNMRAFLARLRKKMNLKSLVITLAAIVVFTTTYLLILPAFTLDKEEAVEQGGIDVVAIETEAQEEAEEKTEEAASDEADVTETKETDQAVKEDNSAVKSEPDVKEPEKADEVRLLTKKTTISADKGRSDKFAVSAVIGKDAKVPEDVTITATELDKDTEGFEFDQYKKDALAALRKDSNDVKGIKSIKFYDISLESDTQEESVEPSAPVSVKIEYDEGMKVSDADNIRIVHFAAQENGAVKPVVLDSIENKVETATTENGSKVIEASFDTDGFSTFAVVEVETIEKTVITSDGNTYKVTVKYDKNAQIPEGSELSVTEVEGTETEEYLEKTAETLGKEADELGYARFFDIKIMNGENEVKIAAPVEVQIQLLDNLGLAEDTQVVHFTSKEEADVVSSSISGDTVNFEAPGFSIYSIVSKETNDLDGKSLAIVHVNTKPRNNEQKEENNTIYWGRALTNASRDNNTYLSGTSVKVERHQTEDNLTIDGTAEVVRWTFEAVGDSENTYYIKDPNGKYLTLNSNALTLSDTPQILTVTPGTGDNAGKVQITSGNRKLQSSVSANKQTESTNQFFQNGNLSDDDYIWMTLCQISKVESLDYKVYSGEKISVQALTQPEDGSKKKYIIYKTIYNTNTGEYEDWVIDGYGNPVKAYDQGDSLSLHSEISPMWELTICKNSSGEPNGYYIFQNETTRMCLCPKADGTLVAAFESDTTSGVTLSGRESGNYTSTIEKWDGSAMHYYGYQFNTENGVTLQSVTGESSQDFSFAEEKTDDAGHLHEVATVDSESAGIHIHMFDYPNRATIASVTGSDSYGVGVLPAQHVQNKLVNGYPAFTNGKSGSTLFDPSNTYHQGTGNHLFLESVYDSTGYYEYSAFNNFAHYNKNDGTFTVYQETGTPNSANNFFYRRGNFMPYNELDTNKKYSNKFTGDGDLIDYENPNNESVLYGLKGNNNYCFGMTIDFNFLMPKDGYEKENPLIYEFNGDDDLWIYIDDVLVLDIGGVHDAFSGKINFATGEITGENGGAGGAKTIKDCFKNAGVFPDGTPWDDDKVDEYFKGNTFVSYGSHKFNMFYMEHGEGASNLHTRFNLPVIEKGKVVVEKKLTNTSQTDYSNVSFAYQIFVKDPDHANAYKPLSSAVYENRRDDDGNPVPITFYDDVSIDGVKYDNVFYLKPNEAAVFSDLVEDDEYYVQEIGVKSDYYDKVFVNDVEIDGTTVEAQNGVYRSSEATPRNRARVTYTNHLDERNSNELRITKRLAEGTKDNGDSFEFRVMLENAAGELVPYYQGTYYIRDDNDIYYRYENGQLVNNGQSPYACTAGNYGTIAHIPPDFTVVIKDLVADTDFYVDEIRVNPKGTTNEQTGILLKDSDWKLISREVKDSESSELANQDIYDYATGNTIKESSIGRIAWSKNAQVVFTNKQLEANVKLRKVDEKAANISGASFNLTTWAEPEGEGGSGSWINVQTDIKPGAPAEGDTPAVKNPVDLGGLTAGRYKLSETNAPDGYVMLTKDVFFEVYNDNNVMKARLTDESGNPLTESDIASITSEGTGDSTVYTITVENIPGQELPMTGGIGTTLFYLFGGMLILGCGTVLVRKRRHV